MKLSVTDFIVFIVITLSINLEYFRRLPRVGYFMNILPFAILLIYIALTFVKYKKISKSLLSVLAYWLFFYFVTLIFNKQSLLDVILITAPCLSICFISEYYTQKNADVFFEAVYKTLSLLLLVDLLSMFIFPDGLYFNPSYPNWKYWFLGYKTERVRAVIIPLITIGGALSVKKQNKLTTEYIFICILSVIDSFLSGATAGFLVTVFLLISILIMSYGKNKRAFSIINRLFNVNFLIVVIIVINILIAIFQRIDLFEYLIVNIMDKELTLTGRTAIWDTSIKKILSSPILGNGYISSNDYIILTHNPAGTSPHNLFLAIAVYTGIAGLVLYLTVHYQSLKNIQKSVVSFEQILGLGIVANLLLGLTSMNIFSQFNYALIIILGTVASYARYDKRKGISNAKKTN